VTGRRVLVDTGAWLAALHRRDQYHEAAAETLRGLRHDRARFVVTDLILAELHLHLLHGLGPGRAVRHLDTIKTDALVEEVFADPALQEAALTDWIRSFDDQPFTFTDAVSFAVMRASRVSTAFTFDHHFAVAGFDMIPMPG
jgi:predicted nucleic acid-binding protein